MAPVEAAHGQEGPLKTEPVDPPIDIEHLADEVEVRYHGEWGVEAKILKQGE
jgi:hypothetical protein